MDANIWPQKSARNAKVCSSAFRRSVYGFSAAQNMETEIKDEIISELWKIKDEMARQADYDLKKLYGQLVAIQRSSSHPVVNRAGKRGEANL